MSQKIEWHGWGLGDGQAIHIGRVPRRKSFCLYKYKEYKRGACIVPLAYFRDEKSALDAMKLLDHIFFPPNIPKQVKLPKSKPGEIFSFG